jgi:GTPase SAR1 family protein
MRIGLVGLPGSGKSTVFGARTGLAFETSYAARRDRANLGVVMVPDARIDALAKLFSPRKARYGDPLTLVHGDKYRAFSFQTLMVAVTTIGLGSLTERDATVRTVLRRSVAAIDRLGFGDWLEDL